MKFVQILRKPLVFLPAIALLALFALKPGDYGAPHDDYFRNLGARLQDANIGTPVAVIDLDRLDRNLTALRASLPPRFAYRIVVKSLPSLELVRYIMDRTGTRKLMIFHIEHLRFLRRVDDWSDCDVLLGKPMPARAVSEYVQSLGDLPATRRRAILKQIQWLVDTPERLEEYRQVAIKYETPMRINVELDVGLHRGGVASEATARDMLSTIRDEPEHLQWSGFMGYEAHAASAIAIPLLSSKREATLEELEAVQERYARYVALASEIFPELPGNLTFNAGGSKTYAFYQHLDTPANDVSMGSGLLKPTDFDSPGLAHHAESTFIATPILKRLEGTSIPFLEFLRDALPLWNPNTELTYFTYGGGWLAVPVSPAGMQGNAIYGFSTNQAIWNASRATALLPNDFLFLRPKQSEAVLADFEKIVLVRQGRVAGTWTSFR